MACNKLERGTNFNKTIREDKTPIENNIVQSFDIMAGEQPEKAPAAPTEQLENLQLDEVTGEKVCSYFLFLFYFTIAYCSYLRGI